MAGAGGVIEIPGKDLHQSTEVGVLESSQEGVAALKDLWEVPRHPVLQPWDEWSPDSLGSCWDAHVMPCGADLGKSLESPGISPASRVPKCHLSAHSNQELGGEGNLRACVSWRFSDAG